MLTLRIVPALISILLLGSCTGMIGAETLAAAKAAPALKVSASAGQSSYSSADSVELKIEGGLSPYTIESPSGATLSGAVVNLETRWVRPSAGVQRVIVKDALGQQAHVDVNIAAKGFLYGTSGVESAASLAVDANGNSLVANNTTGPQESANAGGTDIALRYYSKAGVQLWSRQLGTAQNDAVAAVANDAAGNFYVVGNSSGSLFSSNAGGADAVLAKYSPQGVRVCQSQLGGVGDDYYDSLFIDPVTGDVLAVGHASSVMDGTSTRRFNSGLGFYPYDLIVMRFNSSCQSQQVLQVQSGSTRDDLFRGNIRRKPGGGYKLLYAEEDEVDGSGSVKLIDMNGSLGILGTTSIMGSLAVYPTGFEIDGAGNYYLSSFSWNVMPVGCPAGTGKYVAVKYNSGGTFQWCQSWNSSTTVFNRMHITEESVLLMGYFYSGAYGAGATAAGASDALLVELNASTGAERNFRQWGTSAADIPTDFALGFDTVTQKYFSYVAGYTLGGMFGLSSAGGQDIFYLKHNDSLEMQ